MNFLTPLALIGGLLAIPIILLYMLRLRRREVTISSTFLWQQVIQDREANTPWQRLRRNLLLILQLIILALLVLALARPFITVDAVSAGQVTVLLDASASMNATDINGETRFTQAQAQALDIIDTLGASDRLTVIRVAEVPQVLISRSQDRGDARRAVRDATPSLTQPDWEAALNLAAAGGTGSDDFTVVIIGDGGLPAGSGLPGISGEVRYLPIGRSTENVALTALATGALPGDDPELYFQITNYGQSEAVTVFTLFADDERIESETYTIPGGESISFVRPLPEEFGVLRATLTESVNSPVPDHLTADNTAFAIIGETGDRRVLLITDGNRFLEQALVSIPGLEVVRSSNPDDLPPGFDVYVFDQLVPTTIPDGDLMFINPERGVPGFFALGAEITETANPTVNRSDPRMQFVNVRPVTWLSFDAVLDANWADVLISTDGGPVLLAGEVAGRQTVIMPFNPVTESTLSLDLAWPITVINLMEWFTPRTAITVADSLSVGESLLVRPPFEAETVRITPPEGDTVTLPVERETVVFAGTSEPGVYGLEVLAVDGGVISSQDFAVNLFSPLESQIAPVPANGLTLQGVTVNPDTTEELGQREFWPIIALLALLVLMIEWYAYHRRNQVQMPSLLSPLRRRFAGAAG